VVKADKVKRKLPSLLLDVNTNNKKGWKAFIRLRYQFEQFKKRYPEKFKTFRNKFTADLDELKEAISG
jgi:hypothetical protein